MNTLHTRRPISTNLTPFFNHAYLTVATGYTSAPFNQNDVISAQLERLERTVLIVDT